MCGIAGILSDDDAPIDPARVDRMVRALTHRGPDELASVSAGPVCLGHARLGIIDLVTGQQPMSTADGSVWITFNGEIFNYLELRKDLIAQGHRFTTQSDTEVILHLYQEHGPDCVRLLNGQWAFALWDDQRRTLFLSRDRLGVRPLFYAKVAGAFRFASEIKALLPDLPGQPELDFHALDQVFTFWSALSPRTMFTGITEVPPGHSLLVREGDVQIRRHWQPVYEVDTSLTEQDAVSQIRDLLFDATRIRLRADVPVGAYVSGGFDSAMIAALGSRWAGRRLRTFSIAFDEAEFDESEYQQQVVRALDTEHQTVRCSRADIAAVFPDVVRHSETPLLRTAPAPLFILSRVVRDAGFKVVLTGEGADEVFGGYDIFKEAKVRRFMASLPASPRRAMLLRRLYPYQPATQAQSAAYLRAFFQAAPEECDDPCFSHLPRWRLASRLRSFYSADLRDALGAYNAIHDLRSALPDGIGTWEPLAQAQYLETAHLLPGYILSSQGDRMAMAHSVEGRFPFLDPRVVEFAGRLAPRLKLRVLNEKYILRQAAKDLVPPRIAMRRKQPYRAPGATSFFDSNGRAADYVETLLSTRQIRRTGLFNFTAVERLLNKARGSQVSSLADNMAFVGILSTQLLVESFINTVHNGNHSRRDTPVHRRELSVRPA